MAECSVLTGAKADALATPYSSMGWSRAKQRIFICTRGSHLCSGMASPRGFEPLLPP